MSDRRRSKRSYSKCTSGCKTGGHKSWGECLRAKGLQISPAINDNYSTRQTALDKELDGYESARRQGVSPDGTSQKDVHEAMKVSDATGVAYQS